MPTDVSGLIHFKKTLQRKQQKLLSGEIVKELAEYGESVARQNWLGRDVEVYIEQINPTNYHIVARGSQVAYMEYGTGAYTQYLGNKPDYWQYYMPSQYKHTSKTTGEKGWFTSQITGEGMFTTGYRAANAMWNTAEEMRRKMAEIGINVLR